MDKAHLISSLDLSRRIWEIACKVDHPRKSLLGITVFLNLAVGYLKSEKISVKMLNAHTGAPISVMRRQIRELESTGWVISQSDEDDLRVRVVQPTEEFKSIIEKLAHECHACISCHPAIQLYKAGRDA
jgi:DNA-binding MarR family transcriptional regulator